MFLFPIGFPVAKYGCRVSVGDRLLPRANKWTVRWTGFFTEVDASAAEVSAGLRVLFHSYLEVAGQLMLLEPAQRAAAVAELQRRTRTAEAEAAVEAAAAPAFDVPPV